MNHVWKIYDLERIIADGMVTAVTYACESEIEDASTRTIGYLSLTTGSTSDSGFIAYEDLTEATVLNWVQANVDQPAVETENSASIAADVVARAAIVKRNGTPW